MTDIDWRWTAAGISLYGLHCSILGFLPVLIVFQLARPVVFLFFAWLAVLILCRRRRLSPRAMLLGFIIRHQQRDRWLGPAFR